MGKKFNIVFDTNNKETQRLVLRNLVASANNQISGIYYSKNLHMDRAKLSSDMKEIFDYFGLCFFKKDPKSAFIAANHFQHSWQDRISSENLFSLFVYQSLVINKATSFDKKLTKDRLCDIIGKAGSIKNVVPQKVCFEEKIALPTKNSTERNYLDNAETKKSVLANMLLQKTESVGDETQIETIKSYIEKSLCFGKGYSGNIARIFFEQKMQKISNEKEQNTLQNPEEILSKERVVDGLDISTPIGFTIDGEPIYEFANGNGFGTLSGGTYEGEIYKLNDEGETTSISSTLIEDENKKPDVLKTKNDEQKSSIQNIRSSVKTSENNDEINEEEQLTLF